MFMFISDFPKPIKNIAMLEAVQIPASTRACAMSAHNKDGETIQESKQAFNPGAHILTIVVRTWWCNCGMDVVSSSIAPRMCNLEHCASHSSSLFVSYKPLFMKAATSPWSY